MKVKNYTTYNSDLLFIVPSGDVVTKHIDLKAHHEKKMKLLSFGKIKNLNSINDTAVVIIVIELKGEFNRQWV